MVAPLYMHICALFAAPQVVSNIFCLCWTMAAVLPIRDHDDQEHQHHHHHHHHHVVRCLRNHPLVNVGIGAPGLLDGLIWACNQGLITPHGWHIRVLVRRIRAQGAFSPRTYGCALDPSYGSSKATLEYLFFPHLHFLRISFFSLFFCFGLISCVFPHQKDTRF